MHAALSSVVADLPFVGRDAILDGPRSATGSFLEGAGANVANAYGVFPAGTDPVLGPQVGAEYRAASGHAAENYVLSGYACTRVILDAIARIDAGNVASPADWREAIRAEVTTPGQRYQTAIATIGSTRTGTRNPRGSRSTGLDTNAAEWAFWQMLELPPCS